MPGIDRTGPAGQGPMTGRRMGSCNEDTTTGKQFNSGRGFRRGFSQNQGMRNGYGSGFRHGFQNQNVYNNPETSEKAIIENEINTLKNRLSLLEDKLSKIN